MNGARIRELAEQAIARDLGPHGLPGTVATYPNLRAEIEAAIRQAIEDVLGPASEEMWGGLARDIVFWHDMSSKRTPASLFEFLGNIGREIPQWLRDEPALKNLDHSISKGTRAVIIWTAMAQARRGEAEG